MSKVNEITEDLADLLKTDVVYLCPECNNVTEIHLNPYYYWECEKCNHKEDYTNLPMKTAKDVVAEVLRKYL